LLNLDAAAMAQSIAIAATSIGGLATAADTSVAREYHAGLATQLGINAALAAQRGYLAEESILETKQGFFETIGGVDGPLAATQVTSGLGESWDIVTDMAIKLMPGGHPYHAFAEAAGNAARARSIRPADIATITLSRPGFTALTGPLHPANLIDMAHSPAYFAAAGAADYGLSWQHATPAKIADPIIHALIDKVVVGAPPAHFAERYRQGATVTIVTTDGMTSTSTVYLPKGAGALGLDWAEIDAKYRALMPASGLNERAIEASLAAIHDFRSIKSVSSLLDLLR
jgi:2-methylcitrate dehydratase PrpD